MNRDPRTTLVERAALLRFASFTITVFLLGWFAGSAFGGEAPGADLTAPIPMCSDIKLALADFEGLHSDAFTQYEQMIDAICSQPVQGYCGLDLACGDYYRRQPDPAQAPLPPAGPLLTAALSLMLLKGAHT